VIDRLFARSVTLRAQTRTGQVEAQAVRLLAVAEALGAGRASAMRSVVTGWVRSSSGAPLS
jgi:hypothetical protein